MNEDNKIIDKKVIETEIPLGTVHSAACEPYRVRLFVDDEIVRDVEITVGVNHRGIERIMEGLPVEKRTASQRRFVGSVLTSIFGIHAL